MPGAPAGTTVIGIGSTAPGGIKLVTYQQHLDAFESFLWAFRWLGLAPEDELVAWSDWWLNIVRKHGNAFDELPIVAELWDLSQAHIVSDVRGGLSLEGSISRLRAETDWYKEASAVYDKKRQERQQLQSSQGSNQGPVTPRRSDRRGRADSKGLGKDRSDPYSPYRSKGKGGKDRGKGGKSQPYLPPPRPAGGKGGKAPPILQDHPGRQNWAQADKDGRALCRHWNTVGCTSKKCPFSHSCARCGSVGHTAIEQKC